MGYTVLARKYRPQTFAELVGQDHIATTLKQSILQNRLAHAFLFTGVRGVGKTTTARILARALNCVNGPTVSPCGICSACVEISSGVDMDVLEMDGASNNGVDDIRKLIESVPYRPSRDRYKIIIIDEVHMLSTGAFNALLKTLEEPPSHVKFIFATTELHKVPVTIRSRCQRHDFKMITDAVSRARLKEILKAESIEMDEAALSVVVKESQGSMRDALTLLDQALVSGVTPLDAETLSDMLGIASREAMFHLFEALVLRKPEKVLTILDTIAKHGADMSHVIRGLMELTRDALMVRLLGAVSTEIALPQDEKDRLQTWVKYPDSDKDLQRVFQGLFHILDQMQLAQLPKIVAEMGLLKVAFRADVQSVAQLLARLDAGVLVQSQISGPQHQITPAEKKSPETLTVAVNTVTMDTPTEAAPLSDPMKIWEYIVGEVHHNEPALGAILSHAELVAFSKDQLVLSYEKDSFFAQQIREPRYHGVLKRHLQDTLHYDTKLTLQENQKGMGTLSQLKNEQKDARILELQKKALSHPMVTLVLGTFQKKKDEVVVQIDESML